MVAGWSLGQANVNIGDLFADGVVGVGREGIGGQEEQVLVGVELRVERSLLEGSQELGVDLGFGFLEDHVGFDDRHLLLVLLELDGFLEVDELDLVLGLGLDDGLLLGGHLLLHNHILLLGLDVQLHFLLLHLLEVLLDLGRDVGLGDPDGQDLNPRRPDCQVLVQALDHLLVQLVEDVDVDFLQGVLGAELVDLMVEFVGDPELFVVLGVVKHSVIDELLLELVDNLNLVKVDHGAVGGAAGDVCHHICLDADAHLDELLEEGDAEVNARLGQILLQHAEVLVYAHVALANLVEARQHQSCVQDCACDDQLDDRHCLCI